MIKRKAGKTEKFTNEEAVGFKIEAESTVWDTPRRRKLNFSYSTQKIITCSLWFYRRLVLDRLNRKTGFKFKYETYQYNDLVAYFMALIVLKIIQNDSEFSFPYRLGRIKLIHFKNNYVNPYGRVKLNLHSLRMKYVFTWYQGSIKGFKSLKYEKSQVIKWAINRRLTMNRPALDYFLIFIKKKRKGAWVGAPDRDYDKLQSIIEKNYGISIFRPDHYRLDRGQRPRSRKYFKKPVKKVGD